MAKPTMPCPCGNPHPSPTLDERDELHHRIDDALYAIDKAWGVANRTPSLHDYTRPIGQAMADLAAIKTTI